MRSDKTRELIKYRLERTQSSFSAAQALYERGQLLDCINRLYYACFYAVLAVLLLDEHTAKSHSGVRTMFYKYYVLTGKVSKEYSKFYNELFDTRHEDDYDDFATISPELTAQMLARAGEFLQTLETLINTELEQH